jgi:hypothetical protein
MTLSFHKANSEQNVWYGPASPNVPFRRNPLFMTIGQELDCQQSKQYPNPTPKCALAMNNHNSSVLHFEEFKLHRPISQSFFHRDRI